MKRTIVTTTINPPTEALIRYSQLGDWDLVVVGDLKTPHALYADINCTYMSPEMQEDLFPSLSRSIGWNCIQRRNLGFLMALEMQSELIATVDDDNVPYDDWGSRVLVGKEVSAKCFSPNSSGWFDPVSASGERSLWHRGYPLQFLADRKFESIDSNVTPDIQANFWNGDPDVDAVCRMEHAPEVEFAADAFPFWTTGMTPFNSQNTILSRQALKDYFMFPQVGRMDDIWASFFMVASGYKVIFAEPTVYQVRNQHDLTVDFNGEILGYQRNYQMAEALSTNANKLEEFVPPASWRAFNVYRELASNL